jgi:hypothetical protein
MVGLKEAPLLAETQHWIGGNTHAAAPSTGDAGMADLGKRVHASGRVAS